MLIDIITKVMNWQWASVENQCFFSLNVITRAAEANGREKSIVDRYRSFVSMYVCVSVSLSVYLPPPHSHPNTLSLSIVLSPSPSLTLSLFLLLLILNLQRPTGDLRWDSWPRAVGPAASSAAWWPWACWVAPRSLAPAEGAAAPRPRASPWPAPPVAAVRPAGSPSAPAGCSRPPQSGSRGKGRFGALCFVSSIWM